MKLNLKKRFQNKAFCVAFASGVILLLNQLGLGQYLPANIMEILNTSLGLLTLLGVVVDPTTSGLGDSQLVLDEVNSEDMFIENFKLKEELQQLNKELGDE